MEFGLDGGKQFSKLKSRGEKMRSTVAFLDRANARHPLFQFSKSRRVCSALFLWVTIFAATAPAVLAQNQQKQRFWAAQQETLRDKLNENTLIIATSHPTASYFAIAHDIAAALNKSGDLRLLPIPSDGGSETLRDLLFLRGVDLAIVPANALAQAKSSETFGPSLAQRIAYVARLYNEEVHLVVGRSTKALADLAGRKVAVPADDGGSLFTAKDLFSRFGVGVEIVKMPAGDALDLVRSGELAALLLMSGKPVPLLSDAPKDGSLRLLALPITPAMEEGYVPTAFRAEDYPTLIPSGVVVEGVAVSAVLVAPTSKGAEDSLQRTAKFVPAFFEAMAERPTLGRYAKWEVNLAATLPGWARLPAAEEWLRKAQQQQAMSLQRSFEEFLRETRPQEAPKLTAAQRKKLFDEFVNWTRKSVSETGALR